MLVVTAAAGLLVAGGASAGNAAVPPTVTKPVVRLLKVSRTGTNASWLIGATVADRDRDLLGGRVRIRVGPKGKVHTRRIVAAGRPLPTPKVAAITSATLRGAALSIIFFHPKPGATLRITLWVDDAGGRASKPVALVLRARPGPAVTITATDPAAAEPDDGGTFRVSRTGATTAALTVSYTVRGTARSGSDYRALTGKATIPAGSATAAVNVVPVDDGALEIAETVVATLAPGTGYAVGSPASATVTIADDDGGGPTVTVTATDSSATEPAGPGTFTIRRTGSTATLLAVTYTVTGTADSDEDYTALPGLVVLPAGATSTTVAVNPIDDTEGEPSETVILTLSEGFGYTLGSPSAATVTIADDDGGAAATSVTLTATDPSASEPGTNTGSFLVTRTGLTTTSLTVSYSVTGTAAVGSDYAALTGTATIPAGLISTTITVTPIDDLTAESSETVTATLLPGTGYVVGLPSSGTVTITDDDTVATATVTITATDASAAEPSGNPGTFTVTRTGSTASALTVFYGFGGTASYPDDYTVSGAANQVTFAAGASTATITLTVVDDSLGEGAETATLILTPGTGYSVGSPSSATVTIADDEPVVTIAATDDSASDSGDTGTFTITRTGSTVSALTVNFAVGGTEEGTDYGLSPTCCSVVIPAGAASVTITVTPIGDGSGEGSETVVVTLLPASGYAVGSTSIATVTIADND